MENTTLQTKEVFKRIGYALFAMILTMVVSQLLVVLALNFLIPGIEQSPWYIGFLIGIPFYCVGFPIFLWIMRKIPNGPKGKIEKISFKNMIIIFLISMAGTYIFNIISNFINILISVIKGSEVLNPLDVVLGPTSIISTIIFVGILSPIIEEIVFRGVLLDKLRWYGERTAIFFTAFTFALFHGNLSQFLYAFVLGLIFGYIAIKTNTIRYAIILHIGINLFGSIIMPALALSSNDVLAMLAGLLMITFIFIGVILFIVNYKKIKLESKEEQTEIKVRKKIAYGNIGMILYYIVCLILFGSAIMA